MQFKIITILFVAIATTSVSSAPTYSKRLSCPIVDCIEALGPSVADCATAAAAEGDDIQGDIACLTGAAQLAIDLPDSCKSCADELGVTSVLGKAADAVEGAASDVIGAIGSIFLKD